MSVQPDPTPAFHHAGNSNGISVRDFLIKFGEWRKFLMNKWYLILIAGLIGGVLGAIYAYWDKPVYTAETTFVLEEESGGQGSGMLGQLGGLAGLAGVDVSGGGGLFQGDNIIQLYKSRNMIKKTLLSRLSSGNELLIERYIKANQLDEKWEKKFESAGFLNDTLSRERDSIISLIAKQINKQSLSVTKPDKKLGIISVKITSTDELFAKEFTDNMVKHVNAFYVDTKTKKSLDNVKILQQQTDSVRAVMNGSIYSAAAVADATPNLNPTRLVLRAPAQRSQFSAETNKVILGELVKNLELSKMSLRKETPLIQVIDKPVLPLMREKLSVLKGLILGVFLTGVAFVLYLTSIFTLKNILNNE